MQKTALYEQHVEASARIVDFAGWQMPVNYGSQIDEHTAVRSAAGMFDVSHMTIIDLFTEEPGLDLAFLQKVVANNCGKLEPNRALYGALLNEQGGVIDDLIVYRTQTGYRCVVNASTRDKVTAWFAQHTPAGLRCVEQDLSMIAVQGPEAVAALSAVTGFADLADTAPFAARAEGDWLFGRTGYTGEDGFEVMLPHAAAVDLWQKLAAHGVAPAGLGARDTLRLEAGLNLYGQDLDEAHTPLESNIAWTISWKPEEREFIGRSAIEPLRGNSEFKLTGLVMRDKGVLRHGQRVVTEQGEGVITSGSFSPTLQCSIALARIPKAASGNCEVDIRGKMRTVEIVKPPFVRNGEVLV